MKCKNSFCNGCKCWDWVHQFCEKTQTYPEDILACTMKEPIIVGKEEE